jgi:hypothetical protein
MLPYKLRDLKLVVSICCNHSVLTILTIALMFKIQYLCHGKIPFCITKVSPLVHFRCIIHVLRIVRNR